MDDLAAFAAVALWLGLIQLAAHAERLVRPLRRQEAWRVLMAGMVGLAATFERRDR